jgi:hypothetical protein
MAVTTSDFSRVTSPEAVIIVGRWCGRSIWRRKGCVSVNNGVLGSYCLNMEVHNRREVKTKYYLVLLSHFNIKTEYSDRVASLAFHLP